MFCCLALFGFHHLLVPSLGLLHLVALLSLVGHLVGAACGLLFLRFCHASWWCDALAVGSAIGVMKLTRAVHPPACSNPLILCALPHASWTFLLFPTLTGAGLIVLVALCYHNLRRDARWPKYWF